jgi:cell division protease FtsH
MNEAALLAARGNAKEISMVHLDEGIDRVIAGPERRTLVMSEDDKRRTAFHEGGHALVGHVLPDADPVHKVSIMPRGRALGLTWSIPEQDKFSATRSELRAQLSVLMGGRTAEELVFGEPTTGAANDIERATEIARAMVTQYGMSDTLGPLQLGQQAGEVFLGRDFGHQANYSDEVAARIDEEIRGLVESAHREARDILTVHREVLDRMAAELVEHETLDTDHLDRIMGHLPKWPGTNGNGAAKKPRARKAAPKQ